MKEDLDLWFLIKQNSDQMALNTLFEKYYHSLCAFTNSIISDTESAEELVADALANIWNKRETIEINQNVKAYLVVSCKYKALEFLRKKKEYYLNFDSIPELTHQETADQAQNLSDTKSELKMVLNQMPRKTKTIFLLSRKLKFTYKEISNVLEISEKTVEKHMSDALKILRATIKI